jgi:hypothetical protein
VVAVIGVDPQLIDNLKAVFAPVFDVDECVVQRGAIIAFDGIAITQGLSGAENIRRNNFIQQPLKFGFGQGDTIELFELSAKIAFQRAPVRNVVTVVVF